MAVRLAMIDYDAGNLHSACKGLEYAGAEVVMVESGTDFSGFDGVVLPGDGAFDPAMQELRRRGFVEPIQAAIAQGQPFLGICVGLQLLFESSEEGEEIGLSIVPGRIKRLRPEPQIRIPHMGWTPSLGLLCPFLQRRTHRFQLDQRQRHPWHPSDHCRDRTRSAAGHPVPP